MPMTAFFPDSLAPIFDTMISERHPKHYIVNVKSVENKYSRSQVTRGGVRLSEIDPVTFESKIVPGLYIAGEMLDVDGKCGGNNLHFAWAGGVLSGCAAAGVSYKRAFDTADIERWNALDTGGRRNF